MDPQEERKVGVEEEGKSIPTWKVSGLRRNLNPQSIASDMCTFQIATI